MNLQSAKEAISPVTYLAATWPGRLRGSRQPRAHHRLQSRVHARFPCLARGNRPLVYYIPSCRVLQPRWKRRNSKQQARLFHYLTGQLLTAALVLPEPFGPWPRLPRGQSQKIPRRGCRGRSRQSPRPPGASVAPSAPGMSLPERAPAVPSPVCHLAQSPSLGTALPGSAPRQPRSATRRGPISPAGSREI